MTNNKTQPAPVEFASRLADAAQLLDEMADECPVRLRLIALSLRGTAQTLRDVQQYIERTET